MNNNLALAVETLETRQMLSSSVEIFAAGGSGQESLSLKFDDVEVATFDNIGGDASNRVFQQLVFETDQDISAGQVRVEFFNDLFDASTGLDRNVFIDRIVIDGETFQTESPSVFTTGLVDENGFTGPGFFQTETLNVNGSFFFSDDNTPRNPTNESQVTFVARGTTGYETVQLEIDGQTVATFDLTTVNQQFQFKRDLPIDSATTRLVFVNDLFDPATGTDRNVILDSLEFENLATNEVRRFDGNSAEIFSTGTFTQADGVVDGFGRGDTLHTNGFFTFPADDGASANGTLITVEARGATGYEVLQLVIDGQVVQEFDVTNTDQLASFEFTVDGDISADRIQVQFANDLFDPANNIDRNLIVERLILTDLQTGGQQFFRTDSASTFSTGTFTSADGIVDGFGRGNTLNANGFFQFAGAGPVVSTPGDASPTAGFGLDTTFGDGGELLLNFAIDLVSLPDGRFGATILGGNPVAEFVFFTADGQIDTSRSAIPFTGFTVRDSVFALEDGSLFIVETFEVGPPVVRRFDSDGNLDTSFGNGGSLESGIAATTPDGGFIALPFGTIEKFDSNGQPDLSFGNAGVADIGFAGGIDVAVSDAGNIFITRDASTGSAFFPDTPGQIFKVLPTGQLDPAFGDAGVVTLDLPNSIDSELVVDSQGRLIFGQELESDQNQNRIVRFNTDGSLDTSFNSPEFTDNNTDGLLLEVDEFDRVVGTSGFSFLPNGFGGGTQTDVTLFRLNTDGSLDSSFADGGVFFEEVDGGFGDFLEIELSVDDTLLTLQSGGFDVVQRFNI